MAPPNLFRATQVLGKIVRQATNERPLNAGCKNKSVGGVKYFASFNTMAKEESQYVSCFWMARGASGDGPTLPGIQVPGSFHQSVRVTAALPLRLAGSHSARPPSLAFRGFEPGEGWPGV